MLKIENLVVNYGAIKAIKGINVEVKKGRNRYSYRCKRSG